MDSVRRGEKSTIAEISKETRVIKIDETIGIVFAAAHNSEIWAREQERWVTLWQYRV